MHESIHSNDDLLSMLDFLLRDQAAWWDWFYSDRGRGVPFFVDAPDENLVENFESGRMTSGRVLELGCGPGRNAIYMARQGCQVDAVDISRESINWAIERADAARVDVNFVTGSVFDLRPESGSYDIVYECGCLHHIPPHRRLQYIDVIKTALKPGGLYGLVCFRGGSEMGGAEISDWEVYRGWSMKGGLAYPPERLLPILGDSFECLELRRMRAIEQPSDRFGVDCSNACLFRRR